MSSGFDLRNLPQMFRRAILPAIRHHKAWDLPMIVWENGTVVRKPADEIEKGLTTACQGESPARMAVRPAG